jgi:hypothetical protein
VRSKTATGGEINVLDPGGFGGVTITKSITIRPSFEAGVLVSGTNAIIVSAPDTARVILEGLDIEGLGTGLDGVKLAVGNHIIRSESGTSPATVSPRRAARSDAYLHQDSTILFNGVSGTGGLNVTTGNVANVTNTTILQPELLGASQRCGGHRRSPGQHPQQHRDVHQPRGGRGGDLRRTEQPHHGQHQRRQLRAASVQVNHPLALEGDGEQMVSGPLSAPSPWGAHDARSE